MRGFERETLSAAFGNSLAFDVPLSKYTSFRIGGPADALVEVDNVAAFTRALAVGFDLGVDVFVLGGGTNVLVGDRGVRGLVVVNRCDHVSIEDETITAQSGAAVDDLVQLAAERSLSGLAFAAGLPGTVGGAIRGNAGCYGRTIAECLDSAILVSADGRRIWTRGSEWFNFEYRNSRLQSERAYVVETILKLSYGECSEILAEMENAYRIRRERHPGSELPSAGSYFRNLPPDKPNGKRRSTGGLLDRLGAKNRKVGGAEVFSRHANIIVNAGSATASDVQKLADELKSLARETEGVELEEEVQFIGEA
jgi:UDP-N-acetylmuramate dehydrogenase